MKIITLSKEDFDDFSNKHQFNTLYQSSNYAEFEKITERYSIHYLGFTDDNNNLIGASLMLYKPLFWGYKYAYAPRGILIDYDNIKLIEDVTRELKRLLKKQKFIFITIDPPVVASQRDKEGKQINFNNNVNKILGTFKKCGYEHLGFNLYNESILPRWNVMAPLNNDYRIMYNSLNNNIKEDINYSSSISINVITDDTLDVDTFFETIKKQYNKKGKNYFQTLIDCFKDTNQVKIFYVVLDTKDYVEKAHNLYEKEEKRNIELADIIQSGNTTNYDIPKAINDKLASDKLLHQYKKDIVTSTKLLKTNPLGITLGAALTITEARGVNIFLNYQDNNYAGYNTNSILTFEIMKYFGKENYQYINLGAVTGNFNSASKYYQNLINKIGFNSSILEYIGQFNIIINPTMYMIYKKKYKKN